MIWIYQHFFFYIWLFLIETAIGLLSAYFGDRPLLFRRNPVLNRNFEVSSCRARTSRSLSASPVVNETCFAAASTQGCRRIPKITSESPGI